MNKYLEEAKAMLKSINGLAEGQTDEKIVNNKDAFPLFIFLERIDKNA